LIAVYDHHDYMSERRAALELWTDFLLACEADREWAPPKEKAVSSRSVAV
jgi:hypothetical protein